MRKIPNGLVEYWNIGGGSWETAFSDGASLCNVITYRLNPDWRTMEGDSSDE
jgi:hypothetical protein